MIITPESLSALSQAYSYLFDEAFKNTTSHALRVASKSQSGNLTEVYHWLGLFPNMREWLGDRVINDIMLHGWSIKNRKFESTVSVPREKMEDDTYGALSPLFQQLGRMTKMHPDSLVFPLLLNGFANLCYDGKPFFCAEHPSTDEEDRLSVSSNFQDGGGAPWFLIDDTQPVKPLIWQERIPYQFQSLVKDTDEHVFAHDEYLYGVRARVNAGYGLWQMAYASKAPLNTANYGAARAAMMALKGREGQPLGIQPSLLVVGPSNEAYARRLLKATSIASDYELADVGGTATPFPESNVWHESADFIVTPYLP